MAGDRRATAGNLISHRTMEKVVQADRHSGVAIAGTAGPAIEMIRLFQLQLEHYEKVEGSTLSLEGKANQLSTMVRGNLPAAMQGMVVVPIFAGYDTRRGTGRLWDFDATGGRYEERDYVATGSGSLHAGTVIKVGWRADARPRRGGEPGGRALWEAADADSATGGPDMLRGIYPIVATIDADGWQRLDDDDLAQRFARHRRRGALAMSMPFYVAPEQMMKDRADYARKGIARGRALVAVRFVDGIVDRRREPVRHAAQGQRDLRPHRVRRRRQVQRVRPAPRRRRPGRRPQGLPVLARRRRRPQPRQQYAQMLGNIFTHEMKPMEVEILVAEVGLDPAGDQMFHILYDGTVVDARDIAAIGGDAEAINTRLAETWTEGLDRSARDPRRRGGARRRRSRDPGRGPRGRRAGSHATAGAASTGCRPRR